jgi:hypothetical protein
VTTFDKLKDIKKHLDNAILARSNLKRTVLKLHSKAVAEREAAGSNDAWAETTVILASDLLEELKYD